MFRTVDKRPKGKSRKSSKERGLRGLSELGHAQGTEQLYPYTPAPRPRTPGLTLCPRPQKILEA